MFRGRLMPGMQGDLVILDGDLFAVSPRSCRRFLFFETVLAERLFLHKDNFFYEEGFRPEGRGERCYFARGGKVTKTPPGDGSGERLKAAGAHSHLIPPPHRPLRANSRS